MSDTELSLDIRQMLAQIDRNQAETRKFAAEQTKLVAEQLKLTAEAAKLNRDRFLAPALALAATLGAIATFAPTIIRAIGGHG